VMTISELGWFRINERGPREHSVLTYRFRVRRGWDEISDKMMFMVGTHGMLQGQHVRISSIEISTKHKITVRCSCWAPRDKMTDLKYLFRSIRRRYC
jgi:hypothetical protein